MAPDFVRVKRGNACKVGDGIAGQLEARPDADFATPIIDECECHWHVCGACQSTEPAFPVVGESTRAFGGDDEPKIVLSGKRPRKASEQSTRLIPVDGYAAPMAK